MPRQIAPQPRPAQVSAGRMLILSCLGVLSTIAIGTLNGQPEFVKAIEVGSTISVNPASGWRGASFPVENFQGYTSPFGYRQSPDGGVSTEFHRGLDMAAPDGSYVRSWWTGRVVELTDHTGCGTSVVIQSGPWEHIYCHMNGYVETRGGVRYLLDREGGIQIAMGQAISAGSRIGRVGMTGRTTGPHLHWGLKYGGQWVDPALVLRAMYTDQVRAGSFSGTAQVQ